MIRMYTSYSDNVSAAALGTAAGIQLQADRDRQLLAAMRLAGVPRFPMPGDTFLEHRAKLLNIGATIPHCHMIFLHTDTGRCAIFARKCVRTAESLNDALASVANVATNSVAGVVMVAAVRASTSSERQATD